MMETPTIGVFAGIDGGATTTRARVVGVDGGLIGEGTAGPGSLTLSPEVAADNCRAALARALAGSGLGLAACRLVCGVAGHRQTVRRTAFERCLGDVGALEVIADGYAALIGAHRGAPGAIVITGTGSVGLSLGEDGVIRQVGGFGPVVGDEGGGNWLGREAVRAALKAMDDAASSDAAMLPLAAALIDTMGGDHEPILDWIAAADATRFAALVPLILQHEADGDPLGVHLFDVAAGEICRLIKLAGREGDLPVSLLGGLAETLVPRLPPSVRDALRPPAGDPLEGALLRARELAPPEVYS